MSMPAFSRELTEDDFASFVSGSNHRLFEFLGAHHFSERGGTRFSVWAPKARSVSVVGDFNHWDPKTDSLQPEGAGIWSTFVPNSWPGTRYKFQIVPGNNGPALLKSDPFAYANEPPPHNASLIWDLDYKWCDAEWIHSRANTNAIDRPVSIYEMHLGSWRRAPGNRWLSYSQLADQLIPYIVEMGWTHVEFMPVMEHPFYGSWGYQCTGYFAPTGRYGSPQDLMRLIDRLHQAGIGVILDWVPSHFATDAHGLGLFDGWPEYEPADPKRSIHPDWNSYIFDYNRPEVQSFLLSSAIFWLDVYHADGLRVDAVASMLYLDYSRRSGEWIPNRFGERHNLEAIGFLRSFTECVAKRYPNTRTIAEESTAWPGVTAPQHEDGLGFDWKWDLGWMHDTLQYLSLDPIERKRHHGAITFRLDYAFSERFLLPLSHDEVVHGKGSLLRKMPGNDAQKFAQLRLLLAWMYAQPGKKLLFMGGEFASPAEWDHDSSLNWDLLEAPRHAGTRLLVGHLNQIYRSEPALHHDEHSPVCLRWVERADAERNVVAFKRRAQNRQSIVAIFNFSGMAQLNYRVGIPHRGSWAEILNTDAQEYGGSGLGNLGCLRSVPAPLHGFLQSLTVQIAPLSALYFASQADSEPAG